MIIRYKTIVNSRFDAPFIGTLISAIDCNGRCLGCFNQQLKELPNLEIDADELLRQVHEDPFSQGIILGGLEFLDGQYDEAYYLLSTALSKGMKAMLYTRLYADEVYELYPKLMKLNGLFIKCGPYLQNKEDPTYSSHGVPLATTNQYIIEIGNQ